MTEGTTRLVFAGLGALLGAAGLYFWRGPSPRHNHDEPIIIDNGPLRFDFKSSGALDSSNKKYFRLRACRLRYLTVWKANGSAAETYEVSESKPTVRLYLVGDGGPTISLVRDWGLPASVCTEDDQSGSPVTMESAEADFEYEGNSQVIKAKSQDSKKKRIKSVEFTPVNETQPQTIDLRPNNEDSAKKVKISLCAMKSGDHCPER